MDGMDAGTETEGVETMTTGSVLNAQVYQYLKDQGLTAKEAARRIGLTYSYLVHVLRGTNRLTNSAKFKIMEAFPDTAKFLLPAIVVGTPAPGAGAEAGEIQRESAPASAPASGAGESAG